MALFPRKKKDDTEETYIMASTDASIYKNLPKDRSEILQLLVICVMAVVLIVCVFILIDKRRTQNRIEAIIAETPQVTAEVTEIEPTDEYNDTVHVSTENTYEVLDKYASYFMQYPDLVGWISIEGANVNYPVVQSKDFNNPHFYLDKGPDRQYSESGAIFMDTRNIISELDRHIVIYGHNMKDGSMFGSLDQYKNKYFRTTNNIIKFDTIYAEYKWELINVFITTPEFYYIQTYFENDEDFMNLMNKCIKLSIYNNDVIISPEDKILTLSTCTNDIKDGRLVIQGRLITDENNVEKN